MYLHLCIATFDLNSKSQVDEAFRDCCQALSSDMVSSVTFSCVLGNHFLEGPIGYKHPRCQTDFPSNAPTTSPHLSHAEPAARPAAAAGGGDGDNCCSAGEAAGMAAAFRRARRRLDRLRRLNRAGRFREARAQAAGILAAAAPAGCRRLAAGAARLQGGAGPAPPGYIPRAAVDEMERLIDSAEALWGSMRCVV
jgi:hypothetical protein